MLSLVEDCMDDVGGGDVGKRYVRRRQSERNRFFNLGVPLLQVLREKSTWL